MTEAEFRRLAEAWGADIARWPADRMAAARAVADEPWAAAILEGEAGVDGLFAPLRGEVAGDRVGRAVAGVLARIEAPGRTGSAAGFLRWLLPAAGFAAAGALGVMLALNVPLAPPDGAGDLLAAALALGDPPLLIGLGG